MSIFSNTPFDPSTWDPSTWHAPVETPSTIDDPTFTENRYWIEFHNQWHKTIIVRCYAYNSRSGIWTGDWNHFWAINPEQTFRLEFPGTNPLVGSFFRFAAASADNTVTWGSPQAPLPINVGPPYNTSGSYEVWTETLTGP